MKIYQAYQAEKLAEIEQLFLHAFPHNQDKPLPLFLKKRQEGLAEILAIEDDEGVFLGFAIMVLDGEIALLDYFAIIEQGRGSGFGSEALRLLQKRYADKKFVLDIQSTKAQADNMQERLRRKAFYLRNGMQAMPFLIDILGSEMEVLAYNCAVTFAEYQAVYEHVFGSELGSRVKLIFS